VALLDVVKKTSLLRYLKRILFGIRVCPARFMRYLIFNAENYDHYIFLDFQGRMTTMTYLVTCEVHMDIADKVF
jgi:hypothetical protein